jgi:transposase
MHIDDQTYTSKGKTYRRVLLRNSYRVDGKVRHDTVASLTSCTDEEISALKLALKHKGNLSELKNIQENISTEQGLCVGATWLLSQLAKKLGLKKILGNSKQAKLSLWLIMATLIEQGSRLSATRLAKRHAACDILGIEDGFDEDDLYEAMDWLGERQEDIEDQLFKFHHGNNKPNFYLYDVTSSYFEGQQNELANYGYNRDKKRGKMQIVIGLMTDDAGHPITVEVFEGNTSDPKTVSNQIKKMANRFGVKEVTLVGDRGMIKSSQIEELNNEHQFNYITAITKVQIKKLINDGLLTAIPAE